MPHEPQPRRRSIQWQEDINSPTDIHRHTSSRSTRAHLLPAFPDEWKATGSFTGLRARGGYQVDCERRDGKVMSYKIVADRARSTGSVIVRVNGVNTKVTPIVP